MSLRLPIFTAGLLAVVLLPAGAAAPSQPKNAFRPARICEAPIRVVPLT